MRTLSQWLSYLETLHPKNIDLGLERIHLVATRLQLLPFSVPAITVAGTNGKGSTVATLTSIYTQAGYRVGSYTSPHLLNFNERIQINQCNVTDVALCEAFAVIEAARLEVSLTYFEFTTLAALWIFAQQDLDVVILEVGMGGRLDAVNIVDPIISVITNIALDHTQWLGTTREAIATEKAGILRSHTPAIYGDRDLPQSLRLAAQKLSAPLNIISQDFHYQIDVTTWSWWNQNISLTGLPLGNLWIPNMATALAVIAALQARFPVSIAAISQGVARAAVMGRFQYISATPTIIVDVAHNPAGAQHLVQRLRKNPNNGRTLFVFSMLDDKDIVLTVQTFKAMADGFLIAPLASDRAASVDKIYDAMQENNIALNKIKDFPCIEAAFQAACEEAQSGDRIVVTGSFYTVAAVMGSRMINVAPRSGLFSASSIP